MSQTARKPVKTTELSATFNFADEAYDHAYTAAIHSSNLMNAGQNIPFWEHKYDRNWRPQFDEVRSLRPNMGRKAADATARRPMMPSNGSHRSSPATSLRRADFNHASIEFRRPPLAPTASSSTGRDSRRPSFVNSTISHRPLQANATTTAPAPPPLSRRTTNRSQDTFISRPPPQPRSMTATQGLSNGRQQASGWDRPPNQRRHTEHTSAGVIRNAGRHEKFSLSRMFSSSRHAGTTSAY